jgi:hypothetical protein
MVGNKCTLLTKIWEITRSSICWISLCNFVYIMYYVESDIPDLTAAYGSISIYLSRLGTKKLYGHICCKKIMVNLPAYFCWTLKIKLGPDRACKT